MVDSCRSPRLSQGGIVRNSGRREDRKIGTSREFSVLAFGQLARPQQGPNRRAAWEIATRPVPEMRETPRAIERSDSTGVCCCCTRDEKRGELAVNRMLFGASEQIEDFLTVEVSPASGLAKRWATRTCTDYCTVPQVVSGPCISEWQGRLTVL